MNECCSSDRSARLCQTLMAVVADLAFIELKAAGHEKQAAVPAHFWKMKLQIVRPQKGEMLLSVEPGLLREITRNIYGFKTGQPTRDQELDTLAELLNTIGGRIMQMIVPPNVKYELGLPAVWDAGCWMWDVGKEGIGVANANQKPTSPLAPGTSRAPGMSFIFRFEERRLIFSVVGNKLIREVIK